MALVLRTIRHLRPRQVLDRLTRRWGPTPRIRPAPPVRAPEARLAVPLPPRPISRLGSDTFRLLNLERQVQRDAWVAPGEGRLWDYTFHYFDGLLAPAPDRRAKERWIADWMDRVPVGSRPAWDPYPASRRILNWIRWDLTGGGPLPPEAANSLATQVRHLEETLEYHLMANHLLTNALALVAAGCFFGGEEGDGWRSRGGAILGRELREQFPADGGHYELSPVYHALLLEDLLDVLQMARATGSFLDRALEETARRASGWLAALRRPDGRVPLFNDAAYGQGPEPDPLLEYAATVLGAPVPHPTDGLLMLRPSGYFRYGHGRLAVFGDAGPPGPPYQPGHAHCDLLSFELCWDGSPLIVDTGTSTYDVGERRHRERGTAAHNTLQVGELEQSEIWAGFRMARRASVRRLEVGPARVEAEIRAFPAAWSRLERSWIFEGETLRIRDRVCELGRMGAPVTARLHLHPGVSLVGEGDQWMAEGMRIRFEGARAVRRVPYEYAPAFNRRIPGICLEADVGNELVTVLGP